MRSWSLKGLSFTQSPPASPSPSHQLPNRTLVTISQLLDSPYLLLDPSDFSPSVITHISPSDSRYHRAHPHFPQWISREIPDEVNVAQDMDDMEDIIADVMAMADSPKYSKSSQPRKEMKDGELAKSPLLPFSANLWGFIEMLLLPDVDLDLLRRNGKEGIPKELRAVCWKLLLGYLPTSGKDRYQHVAAMRKEYLRIADKICTDPLPSDHNKIKQQIHVDVLRTHPTGFHNFFRYSEVKDCIERLLFVYALEHPARTYWQGLNDLVTPFVCVFAAFALGVEVNELDYAPHEEVQVALVSGGLEADVYWCLSRLLDLIDNDYVINHEGSLTLESSQMRMRHLLKLTDEGLLNHLDQNEVEFTHFSVSWLICFFSREFHMDNVASLWDYYICEQHDLFTLHLSVCVAYLQHWSSRLKQLSFEGIIIFLQNRALTCNWKEDKIRKLIASGIEIRNKHTHTIVLCKLFSMSLALMVSQLQLARLLVAVLVLHSISLQNRRKAKQAKREKRLE
eukprot:TRINITY_DN5133_c0_g1_i1.p1 TRINITY_DN5133_c0_g1~~TRINITY_DN5133_c0_g1_i1.p1  ORF type:complete len:518 (-),score=92.40 TRINITY_DN5133_c0_g1_i1:53-1579(-)